MKFKIVVLILPVLCLVFAACGGSAIGDAQQFEPNEPPVIHSIKAVNFDGSEITQLDIEPYKQFKLIVEASDPDNNPLEYKFDSASGTFAGIVKNSNGCTAIFKTGSVKGGQNIDLWAGVSDGKGAIVRQSYNLGTGKLGPAITAILDKTIVRPDESIKLSVTANCSGFFQMYSDGTGNEDFKFENDMFRYSYSENKTTDFILGGPEYNATPHDDIHLAPKAPYLNSTSYKFVIVFRDGLFQTSRFIQTIYVDGTGPKVTGFSPGSTPPVDFNPDITVTFDEEIGYADGSCLELTPDHGKIKLLRISENKAYFSVTGLKALTEYKAVVKRVKDIAGNEMDESAPYSFTTISGDLQIKDGKGNTGFTTYRGFEKTDNINLEASFKENPLDIGQVTLSIESPSNGVSVDGMGKVTINPRDLTNENDVTVKIKAVSTVSGDIAYYTVTINSWYPVTAASEFGNDGVISKNLNGRFKLGNDITFTKDVEPIGNYSAKPFTGIFDGNSQENMALSNLTINASADYAGLFSYNKGTIKNFNVEKAKFVFTYNKNDNLGIIAGYNEGRIENCKVNNSNIEDKSEDGYPGICVGGIAGRNKKVNDDYPGLITGCSVDSIVIEAQSSCGGIVGYNRDGTIENCSSSGSVTGFADTSQSGGLIGESSGGKITGCSSFCSVKLREAIIPNPDACAFGGLIGYVNNSVITDCFSTGAVGDAKADNVGGLIGELISGTIQGKTYSTANVTGNSYVGGLIGKISGSTITGTSSNLISSSGTVTGNSNVGGLIGYVSGNSNIRYCFSNCKFYANKNNSQQIGGLIGSIDEKDSTFDIADSNSAVEINIADATFVGGLIGSIFNDNSDINITDCYSQSNVTGNKYVGGLIGATGKATIQGKTHASGDVTGMDYVGGLIGWYNRTSTLIIKGTDNTNGIYSAGAVKGNNYVGGLIGCSAPGLKAEYCYSESIIRVNTKGVAYFGGLIGYLGGLSSDINATFVKNCYSKGSVGNKDDSWNSSSKCIGGLIGFMQYATVSDCYSTGTVLSGNNTVLYVGGLIGQISEKSNVTKCRHMNGAVCGKSYVGGLIGHVYCYNPGKNTVAECFADSEIQATNGDKAGGLIGSMDNTDVVNCYSVGSVFGESYVGGLIGYINDGATSKVSKCYTTSIINFANSPYGELIGYVVTSETALYGDCYFLVPSGTSFALYGKPKTQSELQNLSTFGGWDIAYANPGEDKKTWLIEVNTNGGFPYLRENPPQ